MTDIRALIPPPLATDERVKALLLSFESILKSQENKTLLMLEAETVPEQALPYLTFEHSLSEFIGSRLPVANIREMIANAWRLHEPKGYQEGVEGGVAMLGYETRLIQWWQESPQKQRGTHRIEINIDKPLWTDADPVSKETVRAIWRMIHAMQRWSQGHGLQLVVEAEIKQSTAVAVRSGFIVQIEPYDPGPVEVDTSLRSGTGIIFSFNMQIEGYIK
jgi:phage tail protein, P2 protein I family